MSANRIQKIALRVIEKQSVCEKDVRDMQTAVGEFGFVTREEAATLVRMDLMANEGCEAWSDFFVDTLTAHLVWESRPTGRVKGADAAWLRAALAGPRYGAAANVGALLVTIVREAEEVDDALVELAMAENGAMLAEVECMPALRGAA